MKKIIAIVLVFCFGYWVDAKPKKEVCPQKGDCTSCHSETQSEEEVKEELKQRKFEFTYTAIVENVPKEAKEIEVWIPYPVDKPSQKILDVTITSPFTTKVNYDKLGNAILYAKTTNPQTDKFEITVKYKVERSGKKNLLASIKNKEQYLGQSKLMVIDEEIQKLAKDVTRDKKTVLEKAKAVYDYVEAHMVYDKSGTGWGKGDTKYAYKIGKGNCTDFSSFFISLARAANIPTKFVIGFLLPAEKKPGDLTGNCSYQCWAEFYEDDKGWIPVDPSAGKKQKKEDYFFGTCCENRMELGEGRDIVLEPKQQGEPINYFIYPYCEIDGKKHDNIKTNFSYHDLEKQ